MEYSAGPQEPKIEITDRMIQAGIEKLGEYIDLDTLLSPLDAIVHDLFVAMLRAR